MAGCCSRRRPESSSELVDNVRREKAGRRWSSASPRNRCSDRFAPGSRSGALRSGWFLALPASILAATCAIAADPAPVHDLSSMLAAMRSSPGVVAEFTESKELALLSSPLESAGTIYFIPPHRFVRVVTSPARSRLVVDGDKVRMEDSSGNKALDLSASPIARQIVDSFVVLFNGDEARLRELYRAEYSEDASAAGANAASGAWHLRLAPRSMPLDRMISYFDMYGHGAHVDRMEAVEPDGDRTVTKFGKTDVEHRFTERELADLFAEPAAQPAMAGINQPTRAVSP